MEQEKIRDLLGKYYGGETSYGTGENKGFAR